MTRRRERSSVDLIRDLQDGTITGRTLSASQRRDCVELLMLEGLSVSEIARKVGRCDRTIRRDLQKIRAANALHPSSDLQAKMLGHYQSQVDVAIARLTKLTRDPAASVADKIEATRSSIVIYDRFIERLTCVGLLGAAPSEQNETKAFVELTQVIGVVASDLGDDSQLGIELQAMMRRMGHVSAVSERKPA